MKIKKCVIPIAGIGARRLPITKTVSKEMLPTLNEPVIYLQVLEAYNSGIKEIIFILSKINYPLIKSFFTNNKDVNDYIKDEPEKKALMEKLNEIINNVKFHFLICEHNGSYGAIAHAKRYLKDEFFGVIYGDDLVDSDVPLLKQLIDECQKTNNMVVAVKNLPFTELPDYGIIKYKKENIIEDIIYKKDCNEANGDLIHGRFVLHTKIFAVEKKLTTFKHNELQLPSALLYYPNEVRALRYQGEYFDIGNSLDYVKANIYYACKRKELKKELLNYIKKVG